MSVQLKEYVGMSADVVATVLGHGAVLLDLRSKYFYRVNASGWAILQLAEDGTALQDVKDQCRQWGSQDDTPIDEFISQLTTHAILERRDVAGRGAAVKFEGPWEKPHIERQPQPLQRVIISAFDPSIPLAE